MTASASNSAAGSPATRESSRYRAIVAFLAVVSLLLTWVCLGIISRSDPWYRNGDMNAMNTGDALALNSGLAPRAVDQPGMLGKYALALNLRLRHALGLQPVWNLETLAASPEPLHELPGLIHPGRLQSRIIVLLLILSAAALVHALTRDFTTTGLAVILLCGSSGLLFHGLLTRPELLCAWFGGVLALFCAVRATASRSWRANHLWLFAAGVCVGFSLLEKMPGATYLALCFAWCWVATLPGGPRDPEPARDRAGPDLACAGLPVLAGVAVFGVLAHLEAQHHLSFGDQAQGRLRLVTVVVCLLPLLQLTRNDSRVWGYLLERSRELTLLAAGALTALPLGYLLLRAVLSDAVASQYLGHVADFVVAPGARLQTLLTHQTRVGGEFLRFCRETPFLFASALVLALGIALLRDVPRRRRASLLLLAGFGLGIALVMGQRQFVAQYSIFPQVPLLLVWALALFALSERARSRSASGGMPWGQPIALVAAFVLMLTVYFRVEPKYTGYQDDQRLPVTELTLTFFFDHDVLPERYLKSMRDRYGSRQQFRETLDRYLADPANRF